MEAKNLLSPNPVGRPDTQANFFRLVLTTKLNLLSVRVPVVGNESLWLHVTNLAI